MAILRNNPPRPSLTLPQLQTTLSSLQTATHILSGLTHRNKNQHRATKWWAPFDMLRRSLHKTIPDLEAAIQRVEVVMLPSMTTTTSSSKRKNAAVGVAVKKTAAKQPELERVVERAVWMREVLGPRAYEAFTQLTADRQFAQLGLVLIGVLAQVEAALALFTPAEPEPQPEREPEQEDNVAPMQSGLGAEVQGEAVPRSADLDLGVAVSRDELPGGSGDDDDDDDAQPSTEPFPSSIPRPALAKKRRDTDRTKDKKRNKPRDGEDSTTAPSGSPKGTKRRKVATAAEDDSSMMKGVADKLSLVEAKSQRRPELEDAASRVVVPKPKTHADKTMKVENKPKKKKKKKGGDEFDDLFSSLL
ncbi:unnamed protein product [Discula destructiva]